MILIGEKDVNKIFEGDEELIEKYSAVYKMFTEMLELSHIIRNTKKRRGSIDFELPEIKGICFLRKGFRME